MKIQKQKYANDFEIIYSKPWDDYKDMRLDKGCYILVKVYRDTHYIGVAICDYKHNILKEFRARRAQDIYHSIFQYSENHDKKWFTKLDHAAYLGKELKKAEMCLAIGAEYTQD